MKIDFARQFSREEYDHYWALVERWWEWEGEKNQISWELDEEEAEFYDLDSPDETDKISWREYDWINALVFDFKKCCRHIEDREWWSLYIDGDLERRSYRWLCRNDIVYFLVKNPHPCEKDTIFFKQFEDYKLFKILFNYETTDKNLEFLENDLGWIAVFLDGLSLGVETESAICEWLDESVSSEYLYHYGSEPKIYFQNKEDAAMFKLVWM